jgi:hypothetical protein
MFGSQTPNEIKARTEWAQRMRGLTSRFFNGGLQKILRKKNQGVAVGEHEPFLFLILCPNNVILFTCNH